MNTLKPVIETDANGVITRFDIRQTAHPDYPTIRPHRLAVGFYDFDGGALVRTHRIELDVDGESTSVADAIGLTRTPLVLVNDDDQLADFGPGAPRLKARSHDLIFRLLDQERLGKPKHLPWARSLRKHFGIDPLIDTNGQRMRWLRRVPPATTIRRTV